MNIGWNFRREHLPLEQRSHYVITDGGDQPNVVPRTASVWYYFRQTTYPKIKELWQTGDTIAKGAAMMTGIELLPTRVLGSAWPQHFNRAVAEVTYANIQKVGMPQWSEADQRSPGRCRKSSAALCRSNTLNEATATGTKKKGHRPGLRLRAAQDNSRRAATGRDRHPDRHRADSPPRTSRSCLFS